MSAESISEKREKIKEQRERAVMESVLKDINDAIALEKEGKLDSKSAMDMLEKKLEARITELELHMTKPNELPLDRSYLPATGEVLAENDCIILRMLSESEYDSYMDVYYDCKAKKKVFMEEMVKQELWEDLLQEYEIVASIYDKKSGDFIGYCSVHDMRKSDWELAIEEKIQYRNKGYGYMAMKLFISTLANMSMHRFFRARIDIDNIASQKLVKKLGGYPDGVSELLLHDEELKEFQKDNIDFIDDNIRSVADEFCMDPEDILGYVLEYRIDADRLI